MSETRFEPFVPTFSQINSIPFFTRLRQEFVAFAKEVRANPREIMAALFSSNQMEKRRFQVLGWCLLAAACLFTTTLGIILVVSSTYRNAAQADSTEPKPVLLTWLPPTPPPDGRTQGGSGLKEFLKQPPGGGGGGSGKEQEQKASFGRYATASLDAPQIVAPSVQQRVEQPSLPVVPIVRADPDTMPKMDLNLPLGDPKSLLTAPSDGTGKGDGIGDNRGRGQGPGDGDGAGPGRKAGFDGGDPGGPSGPGNGGTGGVSLRPTILNAIKPKYTEEARQHKIVGKVTLSVEFRADGQIGDIRIVKGLGYGLDENAITAARLLQFRPALSNGQPVSTRARVEFTFNLI